MFVSHGHHVLFVHVQKTGGSSIDVMLRKAAPDAVRITDLPGNRHATLRAALHHHPELTDYFLFGFVRNPWARLLSWYAMVERRRHAAETSSDLRLTERLHNHPFWHRTAYDYADFEEFILRGTREVHRLQVPQVDYLRTRHRVADFVGRTERFDDDVREAFRRAGMPAPSEVERRNAGPARDYRELYTPQMRDRVAQQFAADIDAFGYEF